MKLHNINILLSWFFIPQTLAMGWVAAVGRTVLELFGVATLEEGNPGRIVGALILFAVVVAAHYIWGEIFDCSQNKNGTILKWGHRLILVANLLAAALFIFQLTWTGLQNPNVVTILSAFTSAFGYWVMPIWAIGYSFIYQAMQPAQLAK
jgi:hypothetical protein